MSPWIIFLLGAAVIILAGRKLSDYGDAIAESTGLGKAWIGSILLAGATSLPEVATSMAAAGQGAGNLAMGNVFGSNIFNIAIIVLAQVFAAKPILANVGRSHQTVAAAGMLLSGIAAIAMLVQLPVLLLGVGLDAWLLAIVYLLVFRMLPRDAEEAAPEQEASVRGGAPWLKFGLAAAVVVGAGWFLSNAADQIAASTGLGETFVGGTLLALATSLPEVTVTIASVKRGAYDLALGNVLGSNIFNMLIIVLADLAMRGPQPLLSLATPGQVVAAMLGLVLSGIVVLGLSLYNRKSLARFQWDTTAIGLAYLVGTWLLYRLK